jgi:ferredoxin-NADP reductase
VTVLGTAIPGAVVLALVFAGMASGQVTPSEHEQHHPKDGGSPTAAGPDAAAGGMGGMMDMMHGRPQAREPFPELMNSPTLDDAAKVRLRTAADERIREGTAIFQEALESLSSALEVEDWAGGHAALGRLREGAARMDAGVTLRRAATGKTEPTAAALAWFKREMNLSTLPESPTARTGPFGLSWFHFLTMAALVGFAAVMVVMYYRKMHRAAELLQGLTGAPEAAVASQTRQADATRPAESSSDVAAPVRTGSRWSGRLRVARIFKETPDVKTYRLMNPLGGVMPFTFLPGQYLTVTVLKDGKPVRRSYTIASSPTQHDYVELTVKHEPGGVVSGHLHDLVKEDDSLECTGPSGSFVFTGRECKCILLIGGGVGITPMMSVLRYLTDRAWSGDIYLVYGVHAPEDVIYREELDYLAHRCPNLHVVVSVSHPEGTPWQGTTGRVDKALIARSVPDLPSRYVHVCGPVPFMETVKGALLELGVPQDRMKMEAFGPALGRPVPSSAAAPTPPSGEKYPTVSFAKSHTSAPIAPDQTVLEVADHVGVQIDNSCRVGTCGICRVKLHSGTVTMEIEDGLEPGDKEKNIILACQAKATANVSVEA